MAQPRQTAEDVRRNILNPLSWRAATRDDQQVAQAIHRGEELEAIYGLNEVGLLDECWHCKRSAVSYQPPASGSNVAVPSPN